MEDQTHTWEGWHVEEEEVHKEKNPNFETLWRLGTKQGQFRLSFNKMTGEHVLAFFGGPHKCVVTLERHDLAHLTSIILYRFEPKIASQVRPYVPKRIKALIDDLAGHD